MTIPEIQGSGSQDAEGGDRSSFNSNSTKVMHQKGQHKGFSVDGFRQGHRIRDKENAGQYASVFDAGTPWSHHNEVIDILGWDWPRPRSGPRSDEDQLEKRSRDMRESVKVK